MVQQGENSVTRAADPRACVPESEVAAVRSLFHAEVARGAERVAALEALLAHERTECALRESECRRLQVALADLAALHDAELGRVLADSASAVEAADAVSRSLAEELRTARGELLSTREYVGSLLADQRSLRDRLVASEGRAADLERAVEGARLELSEGRAGALSDLSERSRALAEVQARVVELETTVGGILASRSWRLTRPLRWLLARLRGGRRSSATRG